jgi:hypothetical protein
MPSPHSDGATTNSKDKGEDESAIPLISLEAEPKIVQFSTNTDMPEVPTRKFSDSPHFHRTFEDTALYIPQYKVHHNPMDSLDALHVKNCFKGFPKVSNGTDRFIFFSKQLGIRKGTVLADLKLPEDLNPTGPEDDCFWLDIGYPTIPELNCLEQVVFDLLRALISIH